MSLRLPPAWWMIWVLCIYAAPQGGWCADETSDDSPIRFRRVFVPADRLEDWPRGKTKYLPIEADRFERLLSAVDTTTQTAGALASVRLETARYHARLQGNRLTGGKATLDVVHAADSPVMLLLGSCNLTIAKSSWVGSSGVDAVLGVGIDDKLRLLVQRSGQLQLDWSTAGVAEADKQVRFDLDLPPCPSSHLELELPAGLTPIVEGSCGIVGEPTAVDDGWYRWPIELGGHHRCALHVAPAAAPNRHAETALVRESLSYDFSRQGVSVSAKLKLLAADEPVGQVVVALDPELQLVSAQCGNTPILWSPLADQPLAEGDDDVNRVSLELPEPLQNDTCVLHLRAFAPLVIDRPWRLPRIRCEGLFWLEGDATLLVPTPLLIERMTGIRCGQSGTGPLSAPRVGESAQFQYFAPEATIEVRLSYRHTPWQLRAGTATVLNGSEASARVIAVFRTDHTPWFTLDADVGENWLIDSVESVPPEAVDDWTLEESAAGQRKLNVRLAKALVPGRPVRLTIHARRLRYPDDGRWTVEELVPVKFDRPGESRHLVAVDVAGPFRLQLIEADGIERLEPKALAGPDAELFARLPRNLLFVDNAAAAGLRVALQRQDPRYSGTIVVEATHTNATTIREDCTIRCRPESARVSRIVVRFAHSRQLPLQWTIGAENNQQLQARKLSLDELHDAGFGPREEAWELTLRRPRSEMFEIRGSREVELTDRVAVNLVSLPEAAAQKATLMIRSSESPSVRIENRRLEPIPSDAVSSRQFHRLLATYRYDPQREMVGQSEPAAVLVPDNTPASPLVWAWHGQLQSRYASDGAGQHLAIYRLQNSAARQVEFLLPEKTDLSDIHRVTVDGKPAVWHRMTGPGGTPGVAIDLPQDEKFPAVTILFDTPAEPLGIVGSREPPWLRPSASGQFPVLARHWTVWLPPGFEAYGADPRFQSSRAPQPNWSRRLFGPLGREPGAKPFDPLDEENDFSRSASSAVRRDARSQTERLLNQLGTLLLNRTAEAQNETADWGSLWDRLSRDTLPEVALLVDRPAMARLGLSAQTPAPRSSRKTPAGLAVSFLEKAGVALLIHPDAVVVTSQTDACLIHDYLEPLRSLSAWRILPGPLAEQVKYVVAGSSASSSSGTLITAKAWREQPAEMRAPWTLGAAPEIKPADNRGWTAYRLETYERLPVQLKFVQRRTMQLLGWVTFLLLVAVGWWRYGTRPVALVVLAGGFGFVSLVVAEAYIPVTSGAVLAMLFCLGYRIVRRQYVEPWQTNSRSDLPSTVSVAAAFRTIVWFALIVGAVCAAAAGAESPSVHRVLIPVDAQRQPTGDMYYLPKTLYDQLHRAAAEVSIQPRGCLITGATYRGVLSRDAASGGLAMGQLSARFDLKVFGTTARVRLPFIPSDAEIVPDGILLDGRVTQPNWEPDGGVLLLNVPQPGPCRLEINLRPARGNDHWPGMVDIPIPRVPNSRLQLTLPPGATNVEVPSAQGAVSRAAEPSRLVAELGPSGRLTVRWPHRGGSQTHGKATVEELLWLRVRPSSVVVDAKLTFHIAAGQVRQIRLVADPRLRLDHLWGDHRPEHEVRIAQDQTQVITISWPRPVSGTVVVEARFLLKETSGVGNLRMPRFDTLDAVSTRRWLAVSIDEAMSFSKQPPERFEPVPVSDFLAAWGNSQSQPHAVCSLPPGETTWSMSAELRDPQTNVRQQLAISFDRESALVRFDAELDPASGYIFQHGLQVPPNLKVQHVSVLEEGVERVVRWSQDDRGAVTVFLAGLMGDRQQLSLEGRLTIEDPTRVPLPAIEIAGAEVRSSEFTVFRRPSVLVQVGPTDGLIQLEDLLPQPEAWEWNRPVCRFLAQVDAPIAATFSLAPNHPQVRAEQMIVMQRTDQSWEALVEVHVAREGPAVIDEIRIVVPPPFNGPYRVEPHVEMEQVDPPGRPRQLILRPASGVEDEYRFRIRGPLELELGELPTVPRIELLGSQPPQQWFVLPQRVQGQGVTWETRGLDQADLPECFSAPIAGEAPLTYRMVANPHHAVLRPLERIRITPKVSLADTRIAWQADGTCHGVAAFDLEPGGSLKCPLWLPAQYDLLQVFVAGVPTEPEPVGHGSTQLKKWQVRLASDRLPQRIEVAFSGFLLGKVQAGLRRFEAPVLGDLPVRQSLWTVAGPSLFQPGGSEAAVAPWKLELQRLRNVARVIESGGPLASDDLERTVRWYRHWARRLAVCQAALKRQLVRVGSSQSAKQAAAEASAIQKHQIQVARQLRLTSVLSKFTRAQAPAVDLAELWQCSLDHRQAATRCEFPGKVDRLALRYRQVQGSRLPGIFLGILGLSALVALAVLGLGSAALGEWMRRWPSALGVAAGLAWWLWLSPSLLGWVIVAASLLAQARSAWRRQVPTSAVITLRSVQR